jgi:hypothetical protein
MQMLIDAGAWADDDSTSCMTNCTSTPPQLALEGVVFNTMDLKFCAEDHILALLKVVRMSMPN